MRLVYVNPNSTAAMTASIVEVARKAAPYATITGLTNAKAPPAIQGAADGEAALPGLLEQVAEAGESGADAIVIACFDDTGLAEARAMSPCPVLGIGQSAYLASIILGCRFSVVTSTALSVPVIEENIESQGFAGNCLSVRASGLPVLTIEEGSAETLSILSEEILAACAEDGAEAIILGCAGMAHLQADLVERTGAKLIDGVASSALLARASADLSKLTRR